MGEKWYRQIYRKKIEVDKKGISLDREEEIKKDWLVIILTEIEKQMSAYEKDRLD